MSARREEVAMRAGQSVDRPAKADGVARTAPITALDGNSTGQAAIDIGERKYFVLAIVPTGSGEQPDILCHLLLGIDIEAVFEVVATDRRHHRVDVERGIGTFDRERLAIIAGIAAIGEDAEPQLARLIE